MECRKTFMPLSYSVDEIVGKEAKVFERCVVALLAEKWGQAYSEIYCYV